MDDLHYDHLSITTEKRSGYFVFKAAYTLVVEVLFSEQQTALIDELDLYQNVIDLTAFGGERMKVRDFFDAPGKPKLTRVRYHYGSVADVDYNLARAEKEVDEFRWALLRYQNQKIENEPPTAAPTGPPPDRASTVDDVINSRRRARRDPYEC